MGQSTQDCPIFHIIQKLFDYCRTCSEYNAYTYSKGGIEMVSIEKEPSKKESKPTINPELVMKNLHDQVGVPAYYAYTKAFNVYDNRWRINVYAFKQEAIPTLIKKVFITKSYFLQTDNKGNIIGKQDKIER